MSMFNRRRFLAGTGAAVATSGPSPPPPDLLLVEDRERLQRPHSR
ncbi:twin-arginine translocation signal domain-containing protein, partial [Streptomyces cavourensis]|nr:twin-arginine translocation signal domain-containing protein [Streptomyces cavourensis]